eukprot:TRINITY_DN984_c0_g1_i6.p1 TRINITY_DN984_c0_g1~~TRINITY_DN984_c0_g1_i6.p1  ORF type:complete len:430 (-),score=96.60 TRINITY_DN984_c0_g1_i6:28-1317(-)
MAGTTDRFTETTRRRDDSPGFLGRVGQSTAAMFASPFVLLLACWLLFMNEGWAIKTHQTLNEVRDTAVHISAHHVLDDNSGKLIHATHKLSVDAPVLDPVFQISREAISLTRTVEMFQWAEHKESHDRKLSNGEIETTTTYSYKKEWSSSVHDSQSFRHPTGHMNPSDKNYQDDTTKAAVVNFGGFELSERLVGAISGSRAVSISKAMLPADMADASVSGNRIQISSGWSDSSVGEDHFSSIVKHVESFDGEDQIVYEVASTGERYSSKAKAEAALAREHKQDTATKIGDLRISFHENPLRTVSVLAQQSDSTLVPWHSSIPGYTYGIVHDGTKSVDEMVSSEQDANNMWCWIKRIFGLVLCYLAYSMMLSLIHISEPTRLLSISYAVFCLKKKKKKHSITTVSILYNLNKTNIIYYTNLTQDLNTTYL